MRSLFLGLAIVCGGALASPLAAQTATLFAPQIPAAPGDQVTGAITMDSTALVNGIAFGVCFDPAVASHVDTVAGLDVATANGGGPPTFFTVDAGAGFFTVGCVIDLFGVNNLNPGTDLQIADMTFNVAPGAPGGTSLDFCSAGNPPVVTQIVVAGSSVIPATVSGEIVLAGGGFERGDCNSDGGFNIADAIALLGELFPSGGPSNPITCFDACDGNDDGAINIADAIALLGILFSGSILPEPVNCGPDPTAGDLLDCQMSGAC